MMVWILAYAALGLITLSGMWLADRFGKDRDRDRLAADLKRGLADGHTHLGRTRLGEMAISIATAAGVVLLWPVALLYAAIWQIAGHFRPGYPWSEHRLLILPTDLCERLLVVTASDLDGSADSRLRACGESLGYGRGRWRGFVAEFQPGDALWSFAWRAYARKEWRLVQGHVRVRDRQPGPFIIRRAIHLQT